MQNETRNCQNCGKDFVIEPDDFSFYERVKVPAPTFCPECRRVRRLCWRNERALYKRKCDSCDTNIITMYHPSSSFPVYCRECWYGDGWDPKSYGRDYDPEKTFFEQYRELSGVVPKLALWQRNAINSDYSNYVGESRNIYLSTSVVKESENVFYSKSIDGCRDIVDCFNIINGSESLYENVEGQGNYNSQYLLLCRAVLDSYYCVDCINCSNCFMSYNLRNKKFCIHNKQYTKEDYFSELEKLNLKSRAARNILLEEFEKIKKQAIFRFGNITKCVNVTGNNLLNVKNSKECFEIYDVEDSKYGYRAFSLKDCMDFDYGGWSELLYEYTTGAKSHYNIHFSYSAMESVRNADYTEWCRNCSDVFGCVSLSNEKFTILNKVYPEAEYKKLREKIVRDMSSNPFIDKGGRVYRYGEFFPIELSPWAYNETLAQEFHPITKEESERNGYLWREHERKNFSITVQSANIPDNIDDVDERIFKEVLECEHRGDCGHQCNTAFRITDYEYKFYKKHDIPLPVLCPNCRYYERIKVMPGLKLYERECACDRSGHAHDNKCQNEFETAYSPDRPEKIFCEGCYNKEVY